MLIYPDNSKLKKVYAYTLMYSDNFKLKKQIHTQYILIIFNSNVLMQQKSE